MDLIDKYLDENIGMQLKGSKLQLSKMKSRSKGSSATPMDCIECGNKFKKKLGRRTFEVKCPKCGSYDTEPA